MVRYDSSLFYQVFKTISNNPPNYCMICYRKADTSRLVKPVAFEQFVEAVNLNTNCGDSSICHICEKQASNALKFYLNAKFAMKVKRIVDTALDLSIETSESHMTSKFGVFISLAEKEDLLSMDIDVALKKIRQNTLLMQTEVLLIDVAPKNRPHLEINCGSVHEGENSHEIVIVDEDDMPLSEVSKAPGTTRRRNKDTRTQTNIGQEQTKMVFELAANANSKLHAAFNLPVPPIDNLTPTAIGVPVETPPRTNYIFHPIILGPDGTMAVPTLGATLQNQLPVVSGQVPKPVNLSKDNPSFKPPVGNLANERMEPKIIFDDDDEKAGDKGKEVPAKRPVVNDSKIDWEDKIPMDVITYLDATDPNAEKLLTAKPQITPRKKIMPEPPPDPSISNGVVGPQISQVRSLHSFNRRGVKRPPDPVIIDLC